MNFTQNKSMTWLYDNWYRTTPFLAMYTLAFLLLFLWDTNFPLFLIWGQFVIYLLHQFEEYVLPGGFVAFFNKNVIGSKKNNFPLDDKASFWINIPIIFIAYPISAIVSGYIDISLGIWTAYFSVINAISHVGMFFKFRYNPGLIVSVCLNIPFGIYTIYYFQSQALISMQEQITGFSIGVSIQVVVMIYGFLILKPKVN